MNKKIGLFLDDERNPEDVTWIEYPEDIEWYVVRRMNDFLFCIFHMEGDYVVSFDHDLQEFNLIGEENTGYDCLKYLVDHCLNNDISVPVCYFHTQNPIGKENMESYYNNFINFLRDNKCS